MRGVGLALDGLQAGGLGGGRDTGLVPLLTDLVGSPDGELPADGVSASLLGSPVIDKCRVFVAEVREAGGELVGEKGPCPSIPESGGDA